MAACGKKVETECLNDRCKLQIHSSMLVVGPSMSGKSHFTKKLIKNRDSIFHPPKITKILYCYLQWQTIYTEMENEIENIEFYKGIPDENYVDAFTENSECMLIFDDLQEQIYSSLFVSSFFLINCHHKHLTLISICQNLFPKGQYARSILLNACYVCLFANPKDQLQYMLLGSRMFPGKSDCWKSILKDVFSEQFNYLFIDAHPRQDEKWRLRSKIFNTEESVVIYRM